MVDDARQDEDSDSRIVVVSGPGGFDPAAALFAGGVEVREDDVLVAYERPGNVSIDILTN